MKTKNDIMIASWEDLQNKLFKGTWNKSRQRYISPFSYRGVGNAEFKLKNSFKRIGTKYQKNEEHILRNFKKYAYQYTTSSKSDWEWLSIGQHHGLATRLLDWSFSPLVALHFAINVNSEVEKPAAIWCVNRIKCNNYLPKKLKKTLMETGNPLVFTCNQLANIAKTLQDFDKLSKKNFVIFLEPPVLDARIANQYAHFSILNDKYANLDNWLSVHDDTFFRIIIPAKLKWEIRDRLDQSNITERMLFPGLDGLAQWLNRHYTPRPRK